MVADPLDSYRQPAITKRSGNALCLSGGGFRAALFHLGALQRMNELAVLHQIDTISSVSGGSIVNALLATRLDPWPTQADDPRLAQVAEDLRDLTTSNIREIPSYHWVERSYRRFIGRQTLDDLPSTGPGFVFCATDMANGVNWTFKRNGRERGGPGQWQAGSYMAGTAPAGHVPLSRAVIASSASPPVLGPVSVPIPDAAYRGGDGISASVRLTDGGVYDNLGLEPVWKTHAAVLVSDGGATLDSMPYQPLKPWKRYGRYLGLANSQGTSVRKRWLIANYRANRGDDYHYRGAYWGVGSRPSRYGEQFEDAYGQVLVDELISEIRTDLDAFSDPEAAVLENHGYLNADAALRRWCADMIQVSPSPAPPHAEWLDPERVESVLVGQKSLKRKLPFGRRPFR